MATTETLPGYSLRVGLGPVTGVAYAGDSLGVRKTEAVLRLQHEAAAGLVEAARERGANAVVGLRFVLTADGANTFKVMSAHGTAVLAAPETPEAVSQFEAMVAAGYFLPQSAT